ncbi:MAG TPA: TraR/DksA C4-type zinc finger protein [bacterium]|nr:TraR/DksA C4-type zinc finger protein [bacterium]
MNEKQRKAYLKKLLKEKERILQTLGHLQEDGKTASAKEVGGVPTHIADLGTDVFEKALELDLSNSEGRLLADINEAIEKINKGTYGRCEECGRPIPRSRLDALPYAKYCIACQREKERKPGESR